MNYNLRVKGTLPLGAWATQPHGLWQGPPRQKRSGCPQPPHQVSGEGAFSPVPGQVGGWPQRATLCLHEGLDSRNLPESGTAHL